MFEVNCAHVKFFLFSCTFCQLFCFTDLIFTFWSLFEPLNI
uniref:Uncharacterized protein n=1 Tax=Arundo donax TaxID=35708 RepID=A0A0A8YFI9_ARUDO